MWKNSQLRKNPHKENYRLKLLRRWINTAGKNVSKITDLLLNEYYVRILLPFSGFRDFFVTP